MISFPVPAVQLSASDFLYAIAVVTPVSLPSLSASVVQLEEVTVVGASGFVFAVGAISVIVALAVGVP